VIPGVLAVATPGHTPGHTSHIVTSGASEVYVQADVTHAPFLFARPSWAGMPFYDHDPLRREPPGARSTTCCRPRRCWSGFHYPFPSVAHVEKRRERVSEIRWRGARCCRMDVAQLSPLPALRGEVGLRICAIRVRGPLRGV